MNTHNSKTLFCFGWSYCARHLVRSLPAGRFDRILATYRNPEDIDEIRAAGVEPVAFSDDASIPADLLSGVTHILTSAPPSADGDPVLDRAHGALAGARQLVWVGYLSTTGVYGDRQGGWVDEEGDLTPAGDRGHRRVAAERAWLDFRTLDGEALPVHLFRLAGIYGPGRNALENLRRGKKSSIVKKGQVFSRIHVDDISQVLLASMDQPSPGRAYNVCDDEPSPPQDVLVCAANLLGMAAPDEIPFEDADLSPMARSFYAESKRVSNARIRVELGVRLKHPNYRKGLVSLLRDLREGVG